jgi:hypothetical protein
MDESHDPGELSHEFCRSAYGAGSHGPAPMALRVMAFVVLLTLPALVST